jgi:hypothetical protein
MQNKDTINASEATLGEITRRGEGSEGREEEKEIGHRWEIRWTQIGRKYLCSSDLNLTSASSVEA